ncbi:MAG: polyphenol oxidase family protein [Candidatus Omnitrophota bacterium]
MAVIETADCTPLFFWYEGKRGDMPIGGVIHVGWRGLCRGIETRMLERLEQLHLSLDFQRLHVFLGPSIAAECYEVGEDLLEQFASHAFRDEIFFKISRGDQSPHWVLDVKKGIRRSLEASGIPSWNITESPLCTFCEPERFPSYRRARGTGQRIHNFLCLRPPG